MKKNIITPHTQYTQKEFLCLSGKSQLSWLSKNLEYEIKKWNKDVIKAVKFDEAGSLFNEILYYTWEFLTKKSHKYEKQKATYYTYIVNVIWNTKRWKCASIYNKVNNANLRLKQMSLNDFLTMEKTTEVIDTISSGSIQPDNFTISTKETQSIKALVDKICGEDSHWVFEIATGETNFHELDKWKYNGYHKNKWKKYVRALKKEAIIKAYN